jgi:peptide/nickel transport system ATP-binding protein
MTATRAQPPLLVFQDFSLFLRSTDGKVLPVLEDISLEVASGESMGIVGESGSGKTVLALSALGLIPSASIVERQGRIEFRGRNLLDASENDLRGLRGREIAMIFQEPMTAMNPLMTLFEQIAETVWAHDGNADTGEVDRRVREALRKSGFPEPERFYSSYPHQLSGGMRQRAVLAMALVMEPALLIADEPTTALDAGIQIRLIEELRQLVHQDGKALVFISHDLGVIRNVTDHITILYSGQVMESGPTTAVLERPLHPYAIALINALPRLTPERRLPQSIPGHLPPPDRKPSGCVFSDRCRKAREACHASRPLLSTDPAGDSRRRVRCFFPGDET